MLTAVFGKSGARRSTRGLVLGRTLAILVALVGLALTVTGVADFYYSFGMLEEPRYTHWLWIGLPTLAVGLGLCQWTCAGMKWGEPQRDPNKIVRQQQGHAQAQKIIKDVAVTPADRR